MSRAMQPLKLDFHAARRSAPWAGALLAALAVAIAAEVGVSYEKARDATSAAEQRIASLGKRVERARSEAPRAAATREELAAARDIYQHLSTPWEKLFAALESSASSKVALLGIEPDAKAGTVLISGESTDYLAALNYVLELERSGTLKQPRLVRHEKSNDARGAVAFAVSASWKESQ